MNDARTHTGWRTERWIAFFLFLLFFLPFVARGEEILLTGTFHRNEVRQASSDDWLALTLMAGGWMLQPVRVTIEPDHDPRVEDEDGGEKTGRRVTASTVDEPLMLLRGAHLSAGAVRGATPDAADLRLGETSILRLDGTTYHLRLRCATGQDALGATACALILTSSASSTSQTLATYSTSMTDSGQRLFAGEVTPTVIWAGDLDRDRRLDLLIDTSDDFNLYAPTLYLSSAALQGFLVGHVALFRSTGS